jgi:hypothetical protein
VATGWYATAEGKQTGRRKEGEDREVSEKSLENRAVPGFLVAGRGRAGPLVGRRSRLGWNGWERMKKRLQRRQLGVYSILPGCQDGKFGLIEGGQSPCSV